MSQSACRQGRCTVSVYSIEITSYISWHCVIVQTLIDVRNWKNILDQDILNISSSYKIITCGSERIKALISSTLYYLLSVLKALFNTVNDLVKVKKSRIPFCLKLSYP